MISTTQLFLEELNRESVATRKILERIPVNRAGWQPHEKSFAVGDLAKHVAEIPGWMELMITADVLDFATMNYTPPVIHNSKDLLELFDKNLKIAQQQLQLADESKYNDSWTMRNGEMVYFTLPRHEVIRTWVLNHIVHHRAQLSVYLRLMEIPVPGIYGPSADEM
ncbi:MAG: hypothetical protein NVS3B19_15250 [Ginsengibacter sp.]